MDIIIETNYIIEFIHEWFDTQDKISYINYEQLKEWIYNININKENDKDDISDILDNWIYQGIFNIIKSEDFIIL